jgi:hypothetical protein
MHELFAWHSSWSATLYLWARTLVGIVLWFWVISGAIFALRFLTFVFLDKNSEAGHLAAASSPIPFPANRLTDGPHQNSVEE